MLDDEQEISYRPLDDHARGVFLHAKGSGFKGSGFWVQRFRINLRARFDGSEFWVLNFNFRLSISKDSGLIATTILNLSY